MKTLAKSEISNSPKGSIATTTVLHKLLAIYRESVHQTINDQKYWIEKLHHHHEIGQALADHLKELIDEMGSAHPEECGESQQSWKVILKEQQHSLEALMEVADCLRNTTTTLLKKLD